MSLADDLSTEIGSILGQAWDVRDGQVVPTTDGVILAGGAVKLDATFLYADLADSTALAILDRRLAARVFKAFLAACTKVIKARGGEVRSFDGDRVMGVFVGSRKNTSGAKAALNIHHVCEKILRPKLEARYESCRNGAYKLEWCTGVDTSEVLCVRAGLRNSNDLVWVGRAPNVAAKLSSIRSTPYRSWISGAVFDVMNEEAKISTSGQNMWEQRINVPAVPDGIAYRSSWTWSP